MKEKFKSWAFSKEHGKCDVITLIIYLLGVCTVSFFHEPWFDEAQAWAIARSGSLKEILFEIPHYEGHPPLWHLILVPFAKLGAPYELSLARALLTDIFRIVFGRGLVESAPCQMQHP